MSFDLACEIEKIADFFWREVFDGKKVMTTHNGASFLRARPRRAGHWTLWDYAFAVLNPPLIHLRQWLSQLLPKIERD